MKASSVNAPSSAVARWSILLLGLAFYTGGVFGFAWWILATVGNVPFASGPITMETTAGAIALNLGLVSLFGIQHAIMARPAFKQRWTKIVPVALERSIFTLCAGGLMSLAMWMWQPMTQQIWLVETPVLRVVLWSLAAFGFTYLFAATFAIDHFELFGLRQVFRNLRSYTTPAPAFQQRWMYRFDRHPIMSGVLIGLWFTPDMRLDHLILAAGFSMYVIVGVAIEERDLVKLHGDSYREYRRNVGTLVPRLGARD